MPLPSVPDLPRIWRPISRQINLRNPAWTPAPTSDGEQAELALIQRFEKCDMGSLCDPLALEPDALVKRVRRALTHGSTDDRKVPSCAKFKF